MLVEGHVPHTDTAGRTSIDVAMTHRGNHLSMIRTGILCQGRTIYQHCACDVCGYVPQNDNECSLLHTTFVFDAVSGLIPRTDIGSRGCLTEAWSGADLCLG